MTLRPSVRFEVFKRDAFTCQYCGRRVPDVILECDHIIPKAEGGPDDIENLVTACMDCNRGKGPRPLDHRAPVPDMEEQTDLIAERERQLRSYHAVQAAVAQRRDAQFNLVWNHWFELWGVEDMERYYTPGKQALRDYIDKLGPDAVMEAMQIARDRFSTLNTTPLRYMFGVLKRKIARLEGRVVPCTICGKDIVLDAGEDPAGGWHHNSCAEGRAE